MEKIEKNQFYGICTIEEIFEKMISLWSTRSLRIQRTLLGEAIYKNTDCFGQNPRNDIR